MVASSRDEKRVFFPAGVFRSRVPDQGWGPFVTAPHGRDRRQPGGQPDNNVGKPLVRGGKNRYSGGVHWPATPALTTTSSAVWCGARAHDRPHSAHDATTPLG